LLAVAWAQHSNENPLAKIQLDIVNAYCSADRQAQFVSLSLVATEMQNRPSKLPLYDNRLVQVGDDIPCPSCLYHYWSYFESIKGTISVLHFSCNQGQAHKIACCQGGQQGDAFETVHFAVTTFSSFVRVFARHTACTKDTICDSVSIVVSLTECLALTAELKQVLKQDFEILTCQSSIASFQAIESTTRILRALLSKLLLRPILS